MPIIDIELVCATERQFAEVSARSVADALGLVLGSQPGRTWIKLRHLSCQAYAENQSEVGADELPVFVTVLHAHPPVGEALAQEVQDITSALAKCLARSPERVHVQYAPAAAGRQAFGGRLVS